MGRSLRLSAIQPDLMEPQVTERACLKKKVHSP